MVIIMLLVPLLHAGLLFLMNVALVLAGIVAIGLLIYSVIRWDASRQMDAYLSKVLAQIDGQEPIEALPALNTRSVEWQELVLTNFEWRHTMSFVRKTEDGEIRTTVKSEPEKAMVWMYLDEDPIENLEYSNVGESALAARHVRKWMRKRMLPELQAAKVLRESESRRLAAEATKAAAEIEAKRQQYRRKYLP